MPPVTWNPLAYDARLAALHLPRPGDTLNKDQAQQLALDVALRGVGAVAPNPLVGAVIVDEAHRFVAAGAHERVGGAHGEAAALLAATGGSTASAGAMRGKTIYITLEPCAHEGKRTPPCAPRMVEAGFARVVYGALDANPKVNGKGVEIMRAAGIETVFDANWHAKCERLAEVYLGNARRGRPLIGVKAAATMDAAVARRGDRRAWITGERAREYGHFLRLWYDAIVVGRATLVADDPSLDPRGAIAGGRRLPWRIVVGQPEGVDVARLKMLKCGPERVMWCATPAAWAKCPASAAALRALGARVVAVEGDAAGRMAATALVRAIVAEAAEGTGAAATTLPITSILIEGGAGTYAPFFADGLVDRLHLFQAPLLFGDADALRLGDGAGRLTMPRASSIEITPLGDDWVVEAAWRTS